MRRAAVVVAVMLVSGCEDGPRYDNKPLVSKVSPPTADQVAAAQRAQPVATPIPAAQTPAEAMTGRILKGDATVADVAELVKLAEPNSKRITFAHLKKNADRYKGEPWAFRGKILEIAEVDGRTRARVAMDDYGQKVLWVEAPFLTDFVEDKIVDVVGILAGAYSYKSEAGWDITIPALIAAKIAKRGDLVKRKRSSADDDE